MSAKKVIIIEDDKMLSTVYSMFLNELGHELLGFYIDPNEAFKKIEEEKPDIALIDIFLPGEIDGIKASNYIQDTYNIPVVYLSSSTDDEIINRALSSNIYGYLLKPIDKTSLRINIELACAKFDYFEEIKYYSQIPKIVNTSIATFNENGVIKWFNNSFKQLFKIPIDNKFNTILAGLGIDIFEELQTKIIKNNYFETILNFKINSIANIEPYLISATKLLENNDTVITINKLPFDFNIEDILSDINANYSTFFKNSSEGVLFFNENNQVFDYNLRAKVIAEKILRIKELEGKDIFKIFHFFSTSELKSLINNVRDGISHFLERKIEYTKSNYFIKIVFSPVLEEFNTNKYCIIIDDITDYKEIKLENKNMYAELKPIVESSIQKFYLCDTNYKIVSFNKAAYDTILKEYNIKLEKGSSILDFVPKEIGVTKFKEFFKQALNGEHIVTKNKIKSPTGKVVWDEAHLDPVINDKGEITGVLLWTLDITEHEKSLIELKKSQDRYELVANGGNDGIWDWDMETNEIYISPRWKVVLGYKDYEIENKFGVRDSLIHPDDLERSKKILEKYLAGETEVYENEIRLKHKNGEYRWVIERGIALRDETGKAYRLAGSITDITDRKLMLEKLSELNKNLLAERKLFDKGNIAVIKADSKNILVSYVSSNIKNITGYNNIELINGEIKIDDIILDEDKETHVKIREEAIKNNKLEIKYPDYRIKKKNGEIIWIRDFTIIERDENDEVEQLLGYYIDVTEYKNLEENTSENEEKFENIFQNANDPIIILEGTKVININLATIKLFGFLKDEILNNDIKKILPEKQTSITNSIEKHNRKMLEAREGNMEPYYWIFKNKSDEIIQSEVSLTYTSFKGKELYYMFIRDITYRKEIEESLKKNKERNEKIITAIPDIVLIFNKNAVCTYFKPDFEKKFNFDKELIIGKGIEYFFTSIKRKTIKEKITKSIANKKVINYKFNTSTPVGDYNFEARISPLSDSEAIVIVRELEKC